MPPAPLRLKTGNGCAPTGCRNAPVPRGPGRLLSSKCGPPPARAGPECSLAARSAQLPAFATAAGRARAGFDPVGDAYLFRSIGCAILGQGLRRIVHASAIICHLSGQIGQLSDNFRFLRAGWRNRKFILGLAFTSALVLISQPESVASGCMERVLQCGSSQRPGRWKRTGRSFT